MVWALSTYSSSDVLGLDVVSCPGPGPFIASTLMVHINDTGLYDVGGFHPHRLLHLRTLALWSLTASAAGKARLNNLEAGPSCGVPRARGIHPASGTGTTSSYRLANRSTATLTAGGSPRLTNSDPSPL